jgi:hypothetical protein
MLFTFDSDLAAARGQQHDFLFRMCVRRVRGHAGLQFQAARCHAFQLLGGAVEVDSQISESLTRELCALAVEDHVWNLGGGAKLTLCQQARSQQGEKFSAIVHELLLGEAA